MRGREGGEARREEAGGLRLPWGEEYVARGVGFIAGFFIAPLLSLRQGEAVPAAAGPAALASALAPAPPRADPPALVHVFLAFRSSRNAADEGENALHLQVCSSRQASAIKRRPEPPEHRPAAAPQLRPQHLAVLRVLHAQQPLDNTP